jgi:hypothetical protein
MSAPRSFRPADAGGRFALAEIRRLIALPWVPGSWYRTQHTYQLRSSHLLIERLFGLTLSTDHDEALVRLARRSVQILYLVNSTSDDYVSLEVPSGAHSVFVAPPELSSDSAEVYRALRSDRLSAGAARTAALGVVAGSSSSLAPRAS